MPGNSALTVTVDGCGAGISDRSCGDTGIAPPVHDLDLAYNGPGNPRGQRAISRKEGIAASSAAA